MKSESKTKLKNLNLFSKTQNFSQKINSLDNNYST
jgi:hypothetical protein